MSAYQIVYELLFCTMQYHAMFYGCWLTTTVQCVITKHGFRKGCINKENCKYLNRLQINRPSDMDSSEHMRCPFCERKHPK